MFHADRIGGKHGTSLLVPGTGFKGNMFTAEAQRRGGFLIDDF
jgi:hypothetical protein